MKKPNNYYCHRDVELDDHLQIQYQVLEKIGEGAFGEVYKIFDPVTSTIKVLKRNKKLQTKVASLEKENQILQSMKNSDGFAKITHSLQSQNYVIMTFLGQNLQKIVEHKPLSIISTKRIAHQLIQRLKELHQKGFVHRDLKPDNILLGNQKQPHKIFLVDFGLAGTFKKNAKHARKIFTGEIGTIKFCPISSHQGLEQFPKDDLQSLSYVLSYLVSKQLPWSGLATIKNQQQKFKAIKELKQKITIDKLSCGVSCLKKYINYVKSLKIDDPIDYSLILSYFQVDCKQQYCYDFCKNNCSLKSNKLEGDDAAEPIQYEQDTKINVLKFMR